MPACPSKLFHESKRESRNFPQETLSNPLPVIQLSLTVETVGPLSVCSPHPHHPGLDALTQLQPRVPLVHRLGKKSAPFSVTQFIALSLGELCGHGSLHDYYLIIPI